MGEPRVRIGISGSYGGLNLGDEAILESILTQLRMSLDAEFTVFTRDPEDTLQRHGVEHALEIRDLTREEAEQEIAKLDLFVLGGGGILYDRDAGSYLRDVGVAQEAGVPVMVYAVSAGPLQERSVRKTVCERLSGVDVITVRDRQGKRLLEDVGVEKEIIVTADPALLLEPEDLPPDAMKSEGLDDVKHLVAFSVREPGPAAPDIDVDHYHELLANAADFIVDRLDVDIIFVPMERRKMDVQHSHAVASMMQFAQRAGVLKGTYTARQMISLLARCDFAVGMRLHFLIFAALADVPFVALPYASKVAGLIEDFEMEMPPLSGVNSGRLIATIDRSWDYRSQIRKRIRRHLPDLQDRARKTNDLLLELVRSIPARAT